MSSTKYFGADATVLQKMASATTGALITSLATTPLEVIKTRMQTVLPTTPHDSPLASVARQVSAGTFDGGNPQQHASRPQSKVALSSAFTTTKALIRNEGPLVLWSGLRPSLVMQIPSTALYFTTYDIGKAKLERRGMGTLVETYAPAISGIFSRSLAAAAVAPLELMRTKEMYRRSGMSVVSMLKAEIEAGGIRSLWRGLAPTLWRDVPFSGFYWLSYERTKTWLQRRLHQPPAGAGTGTNSLWNSWSISFLSGFTCGSLAAAITTPFDVVKTRKQVLVYQPQVAAASSTGPASASLPPPAQLPAPSIASAAPRSTFQILATIQRQEGLRGLFAGLQMRLARIGPACAIMISSYEVGKLVFAGLALTAAEELESAAAAMELQRQQMSSSRSSVTAGASDAAQLPSLQGQILHHELERARIDDVDETCVQIAGTDD